MHKNETACRTHFRMKGFALRLVSKQRHKRTRKWLIILLKLINNSSSLNQGNHDRFLLSFSFDCVIWFVSDTKESFIHICKQLKARQNYSATHCIFNSFLGIWKCGQKSPKHGLSNWTSESKPSRTLPFLIKAVYSWKVDLCKPFLNTLRFSFSSHGWNLWTSC